MVRASPRNGRDGAVAAIVTSGRAARRVHFLHIGKTGGTALRDANERCPGHPLIVHPHSTTLDDLPADEPVAFSVRHPCDRFVSGFNSRLRKGLPRYHIAWSVEEAKAFDRFRSADTLACALFAADEGTRLDACEAMGSIGHTRRHLSHWLGSPSALRQRRGSIVMVVDTARLATDVAWLSRLLGLAEPLALPSDPVLSHRSPPGCDTSLSPLGRENLERWYQDDIVLYRACLALRRRLIERARVR